MKKRERYRILVMMFWLFSAWQTYAGDKQFQIDSLNQIIETTTNDTVLVKAYMDLDNIIYASDPKLDKQINITVLGICNKKLVETSTLSKHEIYFYKKHKGAALNNLGVIAKTQGNLDSALFYNQESLKLKVEINDKKGVGNSYINIGSIYHQKGDLVTALNYYFKCLELRESIKDEKGIATLLINIGAIYHYQDDYANASKYYFESIERFKQLGDSKGVANAYSNLGTVYLEQGDSSKRAGNMEYANKKYDHALSNYELALRVDLELDSKIGIAKDYNNMGSANYKKGNLDTALVYFFKCAELRDALQIKSGLASCYYNIANIYYDKGNYNKSKQYGEKSYALAKEVNSILELNGASAVLHRTYKKLGKYKEALQMHEEWYMSEDSLSSKERSVQTIQQYYRYEYEKKSTADSVQNAKMQEVKDLQIQKQDAELNAKRNQQIALFGGLLLMLVFAVIMYNRFQVTRKQKHIIELQKEIVEEKQKEILDSILYAKRIQQAILPPDKTVRKHLPDHFILYLPKDIVAGDFYWLESKPDKILFAAADCTGHGVPGAMVSVVCNNGLNRSVRELNITTPGKILDKTREIVIQEFEKSEDDVKDGMDISLCAITPSSQMLEWAGANNPLWIIRNDQLIEFKPDKQPIGKIENAKDFTTQSIQLEQGDVIYVFTDGFQDQFGGEKGKKFKASQLKDLLLSISKEPMEQQKHILQKSLQSWRGSLEQVDDVCLVGVRV
ncbi:MAG: tetratricopeptide repeat protein [Crocinitomicaceae bacterium]|nr:tetratricopeptide repeat protein [Crocinitomicaceae bacterium]MBK8926909.1 tetratricopeptide repeat protein [Crocinitomicaceae bacterium]